MSIIASRDQAQIVIQTAFSEPDGTIKTNISSATARVYQIISGAEVDVLAETELLQVGTTNKYRYVWEPASLDVGEYWVDYNSSDTDLNLSRVTEQFVVLNAPTYDDYERLRKVSEGRWKITGNQIIYYDDDGETPFLTFDTYNRIGSPAMANIMERVPVAE